MRQEVERQPCGTQGQSVSDKNPGSRVRMREASMAGAGGPGLMVIGNELRVMGANQGRL